MKIEFLFCVICEIRACQRKNYGLCESAVLRLDDYTCPDTDEFVELFGVPIRETETSVRFGSSYAFGKRRSMYSVTRY